MSVSALITSAFSTTDLYFILSLKSTATSSQIKKAYHKRALECHPDKTPSTASEEDKKTRTNTFQALSACYDVLSTEGKRSAYDRTGRIPGDDEFLDGADGMGDDDFDWGDYFSAVFKRVDLSDIINVTNTFRNSPDEALAVLKYYVVCKGNGRKMLECVMCSEAKDTGRWRAAIIGPAIERGEIEDFGFKYEERD